MAAKVARPVMRDPTGRWSLAQVAAAAGITYRTARTLVGANFLDPDNLGYKDIMVTRVAAALLDAPRPAGQNRKESADATIDRNFRALTLARQVASDPSPSEETTLVVLPLEVHLAQKAFSLMQYLGEYQGQPMLLLPVGTWAREALDLAVDGVAS